MKAYKITLLIIDHDNIGHADAIAAIENARYPNRCVRPMVAASQEADIGAWDDDHPLNQGGWRKHFACIFPPSETLDETK